MPKPLRSKIVPLRSLGPSDTAVMFSIFRKYYADVSFEKFASDLSKKDFVILLLDGKLRVIRGFSTVAHLAFETERGRFVRGVFSGDTIIEQEYWGGSALQRAFLWHLWKERLRHPLSPFYWFLISKGYKTYLLMANNFAEHFPRHERACPPDRRRILEAFSTGLFGSLFDPASGLIRATRDSGRLKLGVAPIEEGLIRSNPRIAFFEKINPTWREGTELACIARMGWWTPFRYIVKTVWKILRSGLSQPRRPVGDLAS